jgi:hypothetical protein
VRAGAVKRRAVLAALSAIAMLLAGNVAAARDPGGGDPATGDPWLDRVRAFEPGTSAGFGADRLPGVVLGRPEGLGLQQGSLDVVSLGDGGRIVVSFDDNAVVDGPGDDLVIFENPFFSGNAVFTEFAFVEVSADGRNWVEFPYDPGTGEGLAGRVPVLANSTNGLDPLDPASGGDRFDLADVGLDYVRFVRITDAGSLIDDPGNHSFAGSKGGFDLDAAGAIHSTDLGCVWGIVRSGGLPVAGARVTLRSVSGGRRFVRRTGAAGGYRFCRLRPGSDYALRAVKTGSGSADDLVFVGEEQLRVQMDLVLSPSAN